MSELKLSNLKEDTWERANVALPAFDLAAVRAQTKKAPKWIHFGAGNIFRAFPAAVLQNLLDKGIEDTGLIVAEGFDTEIIEKIYSPHDNLSLLVTLKADGTVEKKVIASVTEALSMDDCHLGDTERLRQVFRSKSLQMASFTITEKGYKLQDEMGEFFPIVLRDFEEGPATAKSYMGKIAALCHERFLAGAMPLALVSMDNFSHNGDKLRDAVLCFAEKWLANGFVAKDFVSWIENPEMISFPWTMIDKITPRPDQNVCTMLEKDGIENMTPVVTKKQTYIAPFVNAEECEYLVLEDRFPAGRPALEQGGMMFTTRQTVDRVERMKVCTCLNPLHTALAVFGCLLGYHKISEEMQNPLLNKFVFALGYKECLPVVTDPGIIDPKQFIQEVLTVRLTNPFLPDTPQRIATDTSQKLSIRFGETIKAYMTNPDKDPGQLRLIPLVLAGWCRYLLGIDDEGQKYEVSPDPLYPALKAQLGEVHFGAETECEKILQPLLSNDKIFGVNLCDAGLATQIIADFSEMVQGLGAVNRILEKKLSMM